MAVKDILDDVRIATPCQANWKDMKGDERVRFCELCTKNVYDLSAMTATAARTLVQEREGKICVRFFRRSDGTMLTADCPVGLARVRRRLALSLAMTVAFLASIAGLGGIAAAAKTRCHDSSSGLQSGAMTTIYNWLAIVWNGAPIQPQPMVGQMVMMGTPAPLPVTPIPTPISAKPSLKVIP